MTVTLEDKQKHFLKLIIEEDGYTLQNLVDAYNCGSLGDNLFKYGLELFGFDITQ